MTQAELDRAVIGKLGADGLTLDSSYKEIIACLSNCVSSIKCIATVNKLLQKKNELAKKQMDLEL